MNKKWYIFISLIIVLMITVPYIIAYYNTPVGSIFTGFLLDSMDNSTYISKMRSAENGFSFINLYSPNNNRGGFHFLFYILLGKIAIFFSIPYLVVFHLSRIILSVFLLYSLYKFLSILSLTEKQKKYIFLITSLGGTNEVIISIGNLISQGDTFRGTLDPAMLPFAAMLYTPHFILVMSLQITIWRISNLYMKNKWKNSLIIGILLLIISTIHSYIAVLTGLSAGFYIVYRLYKENNLYFNHLISISLFGIIPLPYLVYSLYAFTHLSMLQEWQKQATTMLAPFETLVAYLGLPFLISIFLLFNKWSWKKERFIITFWLVTISITSLIPVHFQGRLWEGIGIPALILISWWIFDIFRFNKKIFYTITIILLLNSIWLSLEPFISTKSNPHRYLLKEQVDAYEWIEKNTPKSSIILTDIENGNYIPNYTGRYTILGHREETPSFIQKEKLWQEFCEKQIINTVDKVNIDYVLVDKRRQCENKLLNNNFLLYKNDYIEIYEWRDVLE